MRQSSIPFSIVALTLLVLSCGAHRTEPIGGSGNVISEPRPVAGFQRVSLSGSGRLLIEHAATESLTIEAEDNILPHLVSSVGGSRLTLGVEEDTDLRPTKDVVYRLTVKDLSEIDVSGSATVDAKGVQVGELKIAVSGSAVLTMEGRADRQDITMIGSGAYRAEALESRQAAISIQGSGTAVVNASDELDVRVGGSGLVEYVGEPAVTQTVSGSGLVRQQ